MRYITGSKLKGDIFTYRRLKSQQFTPQQYYKSEEIFEGATDILAKYAKDEIGVRAKDNKIMAQYIDTFASREREGLLNKLQKDSAFNVRQYIKDSKRTYWQRLFNIDPEKTGYLTADKMEKRIKAYNKLNKALAGGWFHKEKLYAKQYTMEKEAVKYAVGFVDGKFTVSRSEVPVLNRYFDTFRNQNAEKEINSALNKIAQTPIEEFPESQPSRWQRFKAAAKDKWLGFKDQFKTKRATVISLNNHRGLAKAAAVAAFFALVGTAIKSDSWAKSTETNDTEQKASKGPSKDLSTKTDAFAVSADDSQLTSEQKIWKNFYDTKSQIQADDLGVDLQELYGQVSAQAGKGVFQMPENVSVERFAYTHLMYKAYGLASPLEQAINGDKALSAEQQQQIAEAINTAGENGYGVKKLAQSIAAKHGRNLSNHSALRNAPKHLQAKYVSNLKQVRDLKQKQL